MIEATSSAETPERKLLLAQLDQVQLENQKLRLDLEKTSMGKSWYDLPTKLVPIVTALVTVAGFLWGVHQYQVEQSVNREARDIQSRLENETAQREFMKPWLASQREIYLKALAAAAIVANSDDADERQRSSEDFWRLYQGQMILVETKSVSAAMVQFGLCVDGSETCDKADLNARCRSLGTAMAESMAATAKMTYREFADNQFRYTSGPK